MLFAFLLTYYLGLFGFRRPGILMDRLAPKTHQSYNHIFQFTNIIIGLINYSKVWLRICG
jgi:hypothetical protein